LMMMLLLLFILMFMLMLLLASSSSRSFMDRNHPSEDSDSSSPYLSCASVSAARSAPG
jgi:hypothetical protein